MKKKILAGILAAVTLSACAFTAVEVTNEEPSAFTEVEVCLSNKENPGVMFVESSDETGIWYFIESETDDSLDEDEWTSNY